MENKHTPGPWKISGSVFSTPQGTHNFIISHGGKDEFSPIIAQIFSDGGRLPYKANARLIKAAPDLFKACKDICKALQAIQTDFDKPWKDEIIYLQQAITKATK